MQRPTSDFKRGSMTLEALIAIPAAVVVLTLFVVILRSYYVYDAMDQALFNSAQKMASSEIYASLSGGNGLVEPHLRSSLLDAYLGSALQKSGDKIDLTGTVQGQVQEIQISERVFDGPMRAAAYELSYRMALPGGFKDLKMRHHVRVRSVWQIKSEDWDSGDGSPRVYTTPHGRKTKVYHTDPECWSMKRSWKNPEGIEIESAKTLPAYRECRICEKKREHESGPR